MSLLSATSYRLLLENRHASIRRKVLGKTRSRWRHFNGPLDIMFKGFEVWIFQIKFHHNGETRREMVTRTDLRGEIGIRFKPKEERLLGEKPFRVKWSSNGCSNRCEFILQLTNEEDFNNIEEKYCSLWNWYPSLPSERQALEAPTDTTLSMPIDSENDFQHLQTVLDEFQRGINAAITEMSRAIANLIESSIASARERQR